MHCRSERLTDAAHFAGFAVVAGFGKHRLQQRGGADHIVMSVCEGDYRLHASITEMRSIIAL